MARFLPELERGFGRAPFLDPFPPCSRASRLSHLPVPARRQVGSVGWNMGADQAGPGPGRRRVLRGALGLIGAAGAVAAGGRSAPGAERTADPFAADPASGNLPPHVPEWMTRQGAPVLSPPYGAPSPFEAGVVRRPRSHSPTTTAASSSTPLQDLHGIITPNGLHFERHHAGVPKIDPAQHRLMVHGLVERPLLFSMGELMRFPSVSRVHFIECSGNSAWAEPPPKATVQDIHGLISCCEWTGVPLSAVLAEAGVRPGAAWVLAEGADAAALTRFRLPWRWDGTPPQLRSRATDETGYVQPEREALIQARGLNSGYHYNGIQTWSVAADGSVTYVA